MSPVTAFQILFSKGSTKGRAMLKVGGHWYHIKAGQYVEILEIFKESNPLIVKALNLTTGVISFVPYSELRINSHVDEIVAP